MAIVHDTRIALRSLRRGGSLPWIVVLILAAAIGAVTSIFSIAHAVLLRPLPVVDPDRVFFLWARDEGRSQSIVEVSLSDLDAWRAGQTSFTGIELFGSVNWGDLQVTAPGEPFRARKNAVSAGFFDVFGTRPILGRTFRPEDDRRGAPRRVVLSGDLWRRRFDSDPGVIGRVLQTGEGSRTAAFEIIGVMPAEFRIPAGAEVWIALGPELGAADNVRAMYAVARLQNGATIGGAVAELSTVARNIELKNGALQTRMVVIAAPLVTHLLGPVRPALLAIAGAAATLLLIACANAAALLMVRSAARRREVAVRLALGARRWQIVRQLLAESFVLSLSAAAIGVALAYLSFSLVVGLAPIDVPRLDQAAIDGRALLFALAVSIATAVGVGAGPAWRASGNSLNAGLQQRSESGTREPAGSGARKLLVGAQVAAAVVLLTGAGLFTRSFLALIRVDLGFNPDNVLTFSLAAPESSYPTRERQWGLVDAVIERARQLPDAVAVGAIFQRPFEHGPIGMDTNVILEGQPIDAAAQSRNPILNWEAATPDYFRAMDIRLLRGRLFTSSDSENAPPVVIVSEALANRLWPGQDPVGRRLIAYGAPGDDKRPVWQTVVGVVESARYREVESPRFDLYLPYRQAPSNVQHFMLRVKGAPLAVVPQLRTAVEAIAPGVKVEGVSTMSAVVTRALAPWRFSAVVVSGFSMMALSFAAVGLGALIAYAVSHRTREIGVRIALGAQGRTVVSMIVMEGLWMTLGGLAAGITIAWAAGGFVAGMLFGISPGDGVTFGAVILLLCAVAALAAYLPARRAARIDPAAALRSE